MTPTDFLIFMANQTTAPSIGSWEDLVSVTFDMGGLQIVLESEEGGEVAIPCDDLAELHRLAQISFGLAEGYDVRLEWKVPVLNATGATNNGAMGTGGAK
jgi:hypothetical protein